MHQRRTGDCAHMTESGMVSIHKNWLFCPRTGLCSVWLSIECIMGSQTPDLCRNIIFENQLLFNFNEPSLSPLSQCRHNSEAVWEQTLVLSFVEKPRNCCWHQAADSMSTWQKNSGWWLCSCMNQCWREVGFQIWYSCKDLVFVTPLCILLTIKHYITLSWDQIISSHVLKPFLILSCGHNPLSSSGAF